MSGLSPVTTKQQAALSFKQSDQSALLQILGPCLSANQRIVSGLLSSFTMHNGVFVSNHYKGTAPFEDNERRFCYPGQKNSPLIIGGLKELRHYEIPEVVVMGSESPSYRFGPLDYIEKYLLIPTSKGKPIFVSDAHTHALFGWALAKKIGILTKESVLFHIDEHTDREFPKTSPDNTSNLRLVANSCQRDLEICEFIAPATPSIFSGVYFSLTEDIGMKKQESYIEHVGRGISGMRISLEDLPEYIQACKQSRVKVVVDIDLDFFAVYFGESRDSRLRKKEISQRMNIQKAIDLTIACAQEADFITIATSPDFFPSQKTHARQILEQIVNAL